MDTDEPLATDVIATLSDPIPNERIAGTEVL
jgi:hypothetical protein